MEIALLFSSIAITFIWFNTLKTLNIPFIIRLISSLCFFAGLITFSGWCFSDYFAKKTLIETKWYYFIVYFAFALFNPMVFLLLKHILRQKNRFDGLKYMKKQLEMKGK